ncbi:uncharacterized protein LOC110721771 [Chenopodium quinoa]|uniref:uncharacterized protein LOC110721771 n=1 Tax=Chenopodium quinoa TaxID=63459 RepID=UPI000B7852FA|nr:uncharacterized protein LOC110721771 [Chenopodium quinoa]
MKLKVGNLIVCRILVDTGSSSDIISLSCLQNLKFNENNLEQVSHPLVGFGGGVINPIWRIDLLVRIGDKKKCKSLVVQFLFLKDLTAYNNVIGRPTLNAIKAVIVPALMLIKFVCEDGSVDTLYGDQQTARDCYLTVVKPTSTPPELINVDKPEMSEADQKTKVVTGNRPMKQIK